MMSKKKPRVRIDGKEIFLRYPKIKDAEEFIAKAKASRKFHRNLVNPPKNLEDFRKYVEKNESETNEFFVICENETGSIIGAMNLSQVFYGGFKNAYLGYYLFENFAGRGFMKETLKLTLKYAFSDLKLHRLEANIQPHNVASINLVKSCGFTKEGFSRKYLRISGKWCGHERWAIIKEDWKK